MVTSTYVLSTLLMGFIVLAVTVAVLRSRGWRHYSPEADEPADGGSLLVDLAGRPSTWSTVFVVLVLAVLGSMFAYLNGVAVSQQAVAAVLGGLLVGYVLVGVYAAAKSRNHPHSHAVAESLSALGLLLVIAIAAQLVMA